QSWLQSTAAIINAELGKPAPPRPASTATPSDFGRSPGGARPSSNPAFGGSAASRSAEAAPNEHREAARARAAASARPTHAAWLCAIARSAGLLERRAAFARLTVLASTGRGSDRAAIESLLARRHASELGLDATRLAIAAGARDARERLEHAEQIGARF